MALNLGAIFYRLNVETDSLAKAEGSVRGFQQNTNRAFNSVESAAKSLKNTIATIISLETIRRAAMLTDEYGRLQDRMNAITGDAEKSRNIFKQLETIAGKTGANLNTIIGGYQKLSFAKDTVGATTQEMIKLTESFAQLGRLSGSSPQILDQAMLQFSQGLISGTFQAQEFQSVLEGVPAILNEIAAGMGITTGEVIKLKKEGKLTSEAVFTALRDRADEISRKAEGLPVRISIGFGRLTLGVQQMLGGLDKIYGVTLKIGQAFFSLGEVLSEIPNYVEALRRTIKESASLSDKWESLKNSVLAVTVAVLSYSAAVNVAKLAMIAMNSVNVWYLMAVAIGYVIDQTVGLGRAFGVLLAIGKMFKSTFSDWASLKDNLSNMRKEIDSIFNTPGYKPKIPGMGDLNLGQFDIIKSFQENLKKIREESATAEIEDERIKNAELLDISDEYHKHLFIGESKYLNQRVELAKYFANIQNATVRKMTKEQLGDFYSFFKEQLSQVSDSSKELFEINKAFSIAEILVKTPQAIADAYAFGNTVAGPIGGAAMAGITAGVMAAQVAKASAMKFSPPRAVGGDVFPGQVYGFAENGPEIFTMGNKQFLSTGNARGHITPAGSVGSTGGSEGNKVYVNVYTLPGQTARVQETSTQDGVRLDIIMEQVDARMADGIRRGNTQTSRAMSETYGLNRASGAYL